MTNLINRLNRKKKKRKNEGYIQNKIISIIPFYSNKSKDNLENNIYIGIYSKNYIIICYFNLKNDRNKINENNNKKKEFNNFITIINYKKLQRNSPQKIMKLEKFFDDINKTKNIFLICFPSINFNKDGEATIIEVSNDYKEIIELQSIKFYGGLISSIEIKYKNNYYYLNSTKGIILWDYDYNTKKFQFKDIIPKRSDINKEEIDFKNLRSYKEMIYVEKRNILIIQCNFPIPINLKIFIFFL